VKGLLDARFDVRGAADGEEALALARELKPDLVISDVMMPNLDGFELLRALRDDPHTRDTPIMLLSARAGEEARIDGIGAGADDYLVKPFGARELIARVDARIELARAQRELGQTLLRADREKDEFLALLAHEMRNALAPIRNNLYIMTLSGVMTAAQRRAHE